MLRDSSCALMKFKLRLILCMAPALLMGACASHPPSKDNASRQHEASATPQQALAQALADAGQAWDAGMESEEGRLRYQAAASRVVNAWIACHDGCPQTAGDSVATSGSDSFQIRTSSPSDLHFDKLIPASTVPTRELHTRFTREGVGTPLIAWWKHTDERAATEPFMGKAGYLVPVTATLTFGKSSQAGRRTAVIELKDPRQQDSVLMKQHKFPLAADFSAPGEFFLAQAQARMSGLGGLLSTETNLGKLGLISLEPPKKDRIPVILVHGLMSRPATWQNVVNQLWSDPQIQSQCQFYFFRYPSGVPVIYSAAKLRERLEVLHGEYIKAGSRKHLNQMVLIGHSMGGLVSKSQVQDSKDKMWVNVFGTTPDKLNLPQAQLDSLRTYLEYKANPHVSRVVFVATPHRGSNLAQGWSGAFGSRLVRLPAHLMSDATSMLQGELPEDSPLRRLVEQGLPTSISNLSPSSKFVQTSIAIPLRPGLHIHSIIGNKGQRPLEDPRCSDGVVPYASAHLDGVESEFVVPSGHGAHEHPEAVAEIRRILHKHLAGLD